jgi:hypothetical protein
MVKFFYIIVTYYSHSKSTHNLKVIEFEVFRNSKYVSNFQKVFITCKLGVSAWHIKQSCNLWHKKQKPKVVSIFWCDSKLWQFSR